MKEKRRSIWLPLILAVVFGLAVIITLTSVINPVTVVIAKQSIPQGVVLTADMLDTLTIPGGGKPASAFTRISDVVGQQLAVSRAPGDYILAETIGDSAEAGIPGQLEPGHVSVAVHVDQASGLAGLLRPGQKVTVFGMIGPDVLPGDATISALAPINPLELLPTLAFGEPTPTQTPVPSPTPVRSVLGRIAITNVRVLLVPFSFRYEEVAPSADGTSNEALFSAARTSSSAQTASVIVLDVPAGLVMFDGMEVSPAALISMLDTYGKLVLWGESSKGMDLTGIPTLNLGSFYTQLNESAPTAD